MSMNFEEAKKKQDDLSRSVNELSFQQENIITNIKNSKKELEIADEEVSKKKSELSTLLQKEIEAKDRLEKLSAKSGEVIKLISDNTAELNDIDAKIIEAKNSYDKKVVEYSNSFTKIKSDKDKELLDISELISELESNRDKIIASIDSWNDLKNSIKEEISTLEEIKTSISNTINGLNEEISNLENHKSLLGQEINELESKKLSLVNDISDLKSNRESLLIEEKELSEKNEEAKKELEKALFRTSNIIDRENALSGKIQIVKEYYAKIGLEWQE